MYSFRTQGPPKRKAFYRFESCGKRRCFYLHVLDRTLAYEVDQILTVLPEETESLAIKDGADYVTLITCTPYAVNTHRILVRGHRISVENAKEIQKTEQKATGITNPTGPMLALCVAVGIVIAVILVAAVNYIQNRKQHRK